MDGKYGQTEHTDTKYVSRRQSGCQFDEVSVTSLIDDVTVNYPYVVSYPCSYPRIRDYIRIVH